MVWDVNYFPWETLNFTPEKRRQGQQGKMVYAAQIAAFDIETTRLPDIEQSIMYVWQLCIEPQTVIIGRTWQQFKNCLWHLRQRLNGMRLLCYVHNLSYEVQYLAGIYHFNNYEVFATEPRKVLYCTMYNTFEFRCSYRLTNLSLAAMTKRYNKHWFKRSGEQYDYSKLRFADTPLTRKELLYQTMDVLALVESVRTICNLYGDNLYSIPYTQTGFVRREIKQAMYDYHSTLVATWPDYRCYQLLRAAFRGGNTHANRYYTGEILNNVSSVDISSSYPSQQCNKLFPVSEFKLRFTNTVSYLERCINIGKAVIMRVRLRDISLLNPYISVPYIPISKCAKLVYNVNNGIEVDNGRLLSCALLEMCITDIDYRIIVSQYRIGSFEILEMYTSNYGPLPLPLRQKNIEFFTVKTTLKGVAGQELYYLKAKEMLNSIYGMSVQEVLKTPINFDDLEYNYKELEDPEASYMRRQMVAFTSYAFGVWTTARARESLQAGIDRCGDSLVYVDTDSCKYCGKVNFDSYNRERVQECIRSGAYAKDPKGQTHYMGVYEYEGQYKRFVTLGAKKYAYEDDNGLHITVSGVSKKAGAKELEEKGGLKAFIQDGFVFANSGKTEALYNDENLGIVDYHGRKLNITRNVVIRDVTYTLSMTDDYHNLLLLSDTMLNKIHTYWRNCIVTDKK